ncbi:carboxypeptidase-like regulatory domain-containing protein [Mitsuokella multacida]|uniref:carboxypeptidase-like regulatory domain-containing protein n=1 Tax=Mitsuokella multacida TaxID=52226 RepID=UPI003F603991
MKIKRGLIVLVSACFLCTSLAGTAQASKWGDILGSVLGGGSGGSSSSYKTVHLVGKMTDGDQVPIQGLSIVFESEKGGSWSTHTDASGNYRMNVPSDTSGTIVISGTGWRAIRDHLYTTTNSERIFNGYLHHDYITGKVTDRYENPMHWVKLTFEKNGGTSGVVTVYTDENGNYKATLPDDANYWVVISQDGYKTIRTNTYLSGGWTRNYTMYEE